MEARDDKINQTLANLVGFKKEAQDSPNREEKLRELEQQNAEHRRQQELYRYQLEIKKQKDKEEIEKQLRNRVMKEADELLLPPPPKDPKTAPERQKTKPTSTKLFPQYTEELDQSDGNLFGDEDENRQSESKTKDESQEHQD